MVAGGLFVYNQFLFPWWAGRTSGRPAAPPIGHLGGLSERSFFMSVCSSADGQHVQRVTSRPPHTDDWAHLRRIPRDDLFALLLFAMSLILSIPLWFSVHYYQLGIITCIALAVANVAMNVTIFGSLFLMAEGKNLIAWLRGYWESNVLGIALIVHHCSDGQLRVGLRVRGCKSSRVFDGVIGHYDSVNGQLLDELCLTCGSSTIAVLPLSGGAIVDTSLVSEARGGG